MCIYPFTLCNVLLTFPILYLISFDIPMTLISVIPSGWRYFWVVGLALFIDTLAFFVYMAWWAFIFFLAVTFSMATRQITTNIFNNLNESVHIPNHFNLRPSTESDNAAGVVYVIGCRS